MNTAKKIDLQVYLFYWIKRGKGKTDNQEKRDSHNQKKDIAGREIIKTNIE